MRAQLEAAIRARIEAVAPELVGDLWGRRQVTLAMQRLDIAGTGEVTGRIVCELYADTVDAFPVADIALAMLRPVAVSGPLALLLTLSQIEEQVADGMAVLRLTMSARGRIAAEMIPAGCAEQVAYTTALSSWAPWIGAAHEPHYTPIAGDAPEVGERPIYELLP